MYIAYLCYPYSYDEDDDVEPCINFSEPNTYMYAKVIPIQFSPLCSWTEHDAELYNK